MSRDAVEQARRDAAPQGLLAVDLTCREEEAPEPEREQVLADRPLPLEE